MKPKIKTAVVTGASTGIGRAISTALGQQGSTVILIARNHDGLSQTKQSVEANGGKGIIIQTDLSDIDSVNQTIKLIKAEIKELTCMFNIAGIWHGEDQVYANKAFDSFDQQIILDTYSVGLTSPTILVHGLLPIMQPGSCIINLSGTFNNGAKGWLPYYTSKRALEDFTIGLSQELAERKISVNCVSPSDTSTDEYKKYFPQFQDDAIEPSEIAKFTLSLIGRGDITGKVFVVKKGSKPYEGFHE